MVTEMVDEMAADAEIAEAEVVVVDADAAEEVVVVEDAADIAAVEDAAVKVIEAIF